MSRFDEGHYLLGIEGLALLRAGADRNLAGIERRIEEASEILSTLSEPPLSTRRDLPARDVGEGYAGWAASYDDPGNDTIGLEEPVVRRLLDGLPAGPLLDAACGTGRHAAYLIAAGRNVIGVDGSSAMLERAGTKLPDADLRPGELTDLPLADGEVAGAVCALALSHLPDIGSSVAELARVLSPGGRLVISNPHPFATGVLGWRAVYVDDSGRRMTIPEYPHSHADYVAAFGNAGLTVRTLIEPKLTRAQARARSKLGRGEAFEEALRGIPAVIVWEVERDA